MRCPPKPHHVIVSCALNNNQYDRQINHILFFRWRQPIGCWNVNLPADANNLATMFRFAHPCAHLWWGGGRRWRGGSWRKIASWLEIYIFLGIKMIHNVGFRIWCNCVAYDTTKRGFGFVGCSSTWIGLLFQHTVQVALNFKRVHFHRSRTQDAKKKEKTPKTTRSGGLLRCLVFLWKVWRKRCRGAFLLIRR